MGFFGDFFGGSGRKDIRQSKAAADAALKTGFDQSIGYGNQAFDLYNPYSQQGGQANQMYGQTLGLGTDAERTAAEAQYFNDPAMQQVLGQQSNALLRKYNADGSGTGGGRLALAGARVGLENYGNWQNRLQGLGQQGFQSTGQQAQVRQGQGDTAFGYGATQAGNAINFGNAMSASRNVGVNNLLGALNTGIKAFTAFSDRRLKRDISLRGALSSGLAFYEFRYLWSDLPQIGVMAQEAMAIFPDAVFEDASGYLVVDYSKIG